MHLLIDHPEKVKCNLCDKIIAPKEGEWDLVYLHNETADSGDEQTVYPRCKECYDRENPTRQ